MAAELKAQEAGAPETPLAKFWRESGEIVNEADRAFTDRTFRAWRQPRRANKPNETGRPVTDFKLSNAGA